MVNGDNPALPGLATTGFDVVDEQTSQAPVTTSKPAAAALSAKHCELAPRRSAGRRPARGGTSRMHAARSWSMA